jgi:N-acyl-D-glutamate deacylase
MMSRPSPTSPTCPHRSGKRCEAYIRLIGYAGATGAHMHICRFNSSSKTDVERCAVLIAKAQAQGLPITVEALSLRHRLDGAGGGLLQRSRVRGAQWPRLRSGAARDRRARRFRDRKELLARRRKSLHVVLWHVLISRTICTIATPDISVLYPGGAIASDAMPWTLSGRQPYTATHGRCRMTPLSHPRSAELLHPFHPRVGA